MNWLACLLVSVINGVAIGSEEWKSNVLASLGIMWKGVLAIFIVIAIVIIVVILLNKIVNFYANRPSATEDDDQ